MPTRFADEQLTEALRASPWMEQAPRFEIVDAAGPLLFVIPEGRSHLFSVTRAPSLDPFVIDAMRAGRPIPTEAGGRLIFRGDPPPWEGSDGPGRGWSSNALSMMRLGGGLPHVHKRYRRLSVGVHEPETLRRMRGTGCLPEHTGDYLYENPAGRRHPLGVVYERVDGESIEELLRADLRSQWQRTAPAHPPEPLLAALGALLRRLHDDLAARLAPGGAYSGGEADELLSVVTAHVLADQNHPAEVRKVITERLAEAARALPPDLDVPSGICHGDLHLSHLLCERHPQGAWTVRAIDVSPAAIDPADPAFHRQSPWQDLVALQRGIESLAAYEAAVESARVLGGHRHDACRTAVQDLVRPARDATHRARRLFDLAAAWSGQVMRTILKHYRPEQTPDESTWKTFYLHRLLHELAYNYAHGRTTQVNVDLRHAAGVGR